MLSESTKPSGDISTGSWAMLRHPLISTKRFFRRAHPCTMAALDAESGGAGGVGEHNDLRCAGPALDQRLDLGLVSAADLVLVVEVAHRRLVRRRDEGLAVERQVAEQQPRIVDAHLEVAIVALTPRHAG